MQRYARRTRCNQRCAVRFGGAGKQVRPSLGGEPDADGLGFEVLELRERRADVHFQLELFHLILRPPYLQARRTRATDTDKASNEHRNTETQKQSNKKQQSNKGIKEQRKKKRKEERNKGTTEQRKKGRKEERKKGRKEERKKGRKEERKKGRKEERKKGTQEHRNTETKEHRNRETNRPWCCNLK